MKRMKRKILSLLIATAILISAIPMTLSVSANAVVRKGDVDGDGYIRISDVLEILKYLAGMNSVIKDSGVEFDSARITGGATPVIGDALEILKLLAGMSNLIEVKPQMFTFDLPNGWEEEYYEYRDYGSPVIEYYAHNDETQSYIWVIANPVSVLDELFWTDSGVSFVGLTLDEIAAYENVSTEELIDTIHWMVVEHYSRFYEEAFGEAVFFAGFTTIGGFPATVFTIEELGYESNGIYLVYHNRGIYVIYAEVYGEDDVDINALIGTFKIV